MHEYPLTVNIIETASRHARGCRISKIVLVIGGSSGIVGDCIQMYFDIISEGTPCEGAALEIESVTPMLRCKTCGSLFERKPFSFSCYCGGEGTPTEIGREFIVKQIELET